MSLSAGFARHLQRQVDGIDQKYEKIADPNVSFPGKEKYIHNWKYGKFFDIATAISRLGEPIFVGNELDNVKKRVFHEVSTRDFEARTDNLAVAEALRVFQENITHVGLSPLRGSDPWGPESEYPTTLQQMAVKKVWSNFIEAIPKPVANGKANLLIISSRIHVLKGMLDGDSDRLYQEDPEAFTSILWQFKTVIDWFLQEDAQSEDAKLKELREEYTALLPALEERLLEDEERLLQKHEDPVSVYLPACSLRETGRGAGDSIPKPGIEEARLPEESKKKKEKFKIYNIYLLSRDYLGNRMSRLRSSCFRMPHFRTPGWSRSRRRTA